MVIIGVNERGQKQFLAIEVGIRESTQSLREVLLKLKSRGMNIPQLAIGDGTMGFWAALDEIYPQTRHQRCWVHKTANILKIIVLDLGTASRWLRLCPRYTKECTVNILRILTTFPFHCPEKPQRCKVRRKLVKRHDNVQN